MNTFERSSSTNDMHPAVWPGVGTASSQREPKRTRSPADSDTSAEAPDAAEMHDVTPSSCCLMRPVNDLQ